MGCLVPVVCDSLLLNSQNCSARLCAGGGGNRWEERRDLVVHPLQFRTWGVEDDQRFEASLHLDKSSSRSGEFEFSRLEVARVCGVGVEN